MLQLKHFGTLIRIKNRISFSVILFELNLTGTMVGNIEEMKFIYRRLYHVDEHLQPVLSNAKIINQQLAGPLVTTRVYRI